MEPLHIKATNDTPKIHFDPAQNIFELANKSLPEDAIEFYQPVFRWLENYREIPNPKTIFDFKLEYFNTASSKQIIQVLTLISHIAEKSEVSVRWHYRDIDEDMQAIGEEYSQLVNVPFEMIEYKDRLDY